ncbi:MAG: secondary thiamine-phosphate synthase enzyme YjbQ [Candidatus Hadarchaeum sp.]|uniref:secondary thiamine-phosphate synthase enzyme YjbQ n=1 Tax=Candidatus Hadarchaeum sp. TaxID=2883567 RepID=UPI003D0E7239
MKTWSREFNVSTRKHCEVVDVTDKVLAAVRESGIRNGLLLVLLPHATATLVLNEDEGGLKQDLLNKLDGLVPQQGNYQHDRIDDNAHAHLKSALFSSPLVLPIIDGRLVRGTWQNFLLIEADGPRNRRMVVFAMGE